MSRFIELHDKNNNNLILLNIDKINAVYFDANKGCTAIDYGISSICFVKETVDAVYRLLKTIEEMHRT